MTEVIESTKWFPRKPGKNAQLVVETCPGFNTAKAEALKDFYDEKRCADCMLRVRFLPQINQLQIYGSCPKK